MLGVHRRDELCTQHTGVCRPLRSCTQVGRSGLYFGERSSVPPLGLNWVAGLQTRLLRAHANEHAKVAGGVAEPGARRVYSWLVQLLQGRPTAVLCGG